MPIIIITYSKISVEAKRLYFVQKPYLSSPLAIYKIRKKSCKSATRICLVVITDSAAPGKVFIGVRVMQLRNYYAVR